VLFAFVVLSYVLQYYAKTLAGKNISKTTCFVKQNIKPQLSQSVNSIRSVDVIVHLLLSVRESIQNSHWQCRCWHRWTKDEHWTSLSSKIAWNVTFRRQGP